MIKKNNSNLNWFKITSIISISLLTLFIIILGNTKLTKVYKFDGSGELLYFNNGLLVFTKDNVFLKISDFNTNKNIEVNNINIKLLIDEEMIYEIEDNFLLSKELSEYLKTITINLQESAKEEKIFTKEIKAKILENSSFKIIISSDENIILEEEVKLNITKF